MRDAGEPLSRGQLDRRAAEARAFRDSLFGAALFTGVVLVNGILAILLVALVHALVLAPPTAAEATPLSSDDVDDLRNGLQAIMHRRVM